MFSAANRSRVWTISCISINSSPAIWKKHPHLIHVSSLLLARTSEICGHKCIDWSKVKWPVVEMTHLARGAFIDGAPMRSKLDIDAMLESVNTGIQAMMSFYSGE